MIDNFEQAEGIVLRAIPFRDYDQILTVFTLEKGLIKLIFKGSRSKKRAAQGMCIPLTVVQVTYREKQSELFSCHEMAWLNSYQPLRQSLDCLEAACDCLNALYASQLVLKPAPTLYLLLRYYLDRMHQISNPWILALSFRLKLLSHDGLACYPFICSTCSEQIYEEGWLNGNEWSCPLHSHVGLYWDQEEILQVYRLTLSQSYLALAEEKILNTIGPKIIQFFDKSLQK